MEPSASTTQTSVVIPQKLSSSRVRENAIIPPSGDHSGWEPSTSRTGSEPSAFITWITWSEVPPGWTLSNAILVPSGDHAGLRSAAGWLVRLTRFEPSALIA